MLQKYNRDRKISQGLYFFSDIIISIIRVTFVYSQWYNFKYSLRENIHESVSKNELKTARIFEIARVHVFQIARESTLLYYLMKICTKENISCLNVNVLCKNHKRKKFGKGYFLTNQNRQTFFHMWLTYYVANIQYQKKYFLAKVT